MEIIPLTKERYGEWNDFCEKSDDAWFWHTTYWLEYALEYRPEVKKQNLSFFVFDKNTPLAICPLVLENDGTVIQFSLAGDFGQLPALKNGLNSTVNNQILKFVFEHIDILAKKNKVKKSLMRSTVLLKSESKSNILVKFGYLDASLTTQVIDTQKTLQEIKKDIRHGHLSDITKAGKILAADVFDKVSLTKEIFEKYVDLHFKAAGRVTRPRSTFDAMFDIVKRGDGFLLGAKKDGIYIGFSYFLLYKNKSYYFSACNDPEFEDVPIAHFIQWNALVWMNKSKCSAYEIGWQHYGPTLLGTPSAKEINIDRFKRGFGGDARVLFRGEKYYDDKLFIDVYTKRIQEFAKSIQKT